MILFEKNNISFDAPHQGEKIMKRNIRFTSPISRWSRWKILVHYYLHEKIVISESNRQLETPLRLMNVHNMTMHITRYQTIPTTPFGKFAEIPKFRCWFSFLFLTWLQSSETAYFPEWAICVSAWFHQSFLAFRIFFSSSNFQNV